MKLLNFSADLWDTYLDELTRSSRYSVFPWTKAPLQLSRYWLGIVQGGFSSLIYQYIYYLLFLLILSASTIATALPKRITPYISGVLVSPVFGEVDGLSVFPEVPGFGDSGL